MNRQFNPTTDYVTPDGEVVFDGITNGAAGPLTIIQSRDAIGTLVDQRNVPIHVAKMQEFGVSPQIMASYVNVPWVDVMSYVNKVVKVIGCAIWFSGEFSPQKDPDNVYSGYHKVLFKLEETHLVKGVPIGREVVDLEQNVIIQTSGKRVAEMALVYLNTHGWFDWKPGEFEHTLFGGNKEAGYLAQPVNDLVAKLAKK
jgi:hypothetical protein